MTTPRSNRQKTIEGASASWVLDKEAQAISTLVARVNHALCKHTMAPLTAFEEGQLKEWQARQPALSS
jgi:hypothetical protein